MRAPRSRGSASLHGAGGWVADAFEVRAGKTKHKFANGTRKPRTYFRENEYTQVALQTLYPKTRYPNGAPRDNDSQLTRDVNDWLNKNSNFPESGIGKISRNTVLRVLEQLAREK